MAADILIYQTDLVPVGEDQKQHLELSRDVAIRFNNSYSDTFKVPEPYIPKMAAKIKSLQEPAKKMSKSDPNINGYISLLDGPDDIMRKFKRAVTDSEAVVAYREGKDGVNNLMSIYGCITGKSFEEIEAEFAGKGYGEFKPAVGEAVIGLLNPIREKFNDLMKNKDYLSEIYTSGGKKALAVSSRTLDKVYRKVGFVKGI